MLRYDKDMKEGIAMCDVLDRVENRGIAIGEKRGRKRVNRPNAVLLEEKRKVNQFL